MATGKQYTLSVKLHMEGQEPAQKALESLSSGLKDVRTNADAASGAVASSASSAATASTSWRAMGKVASVGLTGISAAARGVAGAIKTGLLLPFKAASAAAGVLKGALVGVAGVAISAWLQVKATMAALRPASEMEQYSIQLEVMLGSAQRASQRLKELAKYAKETNFSPDQIFEAGNLMQAFGIYSQRNLRLAGDAANAFGKDIREVVTSINYLASGRGGEAFESLSRLGITRQKLAQYGVRFGKSGNLLSSTQDAMEALFSYMERNFGGMTKRQAATWKGVIQQLGGEWWDMLSRSFKGALRPLSGFVRDNLIPAISALGNAAEKLNWGKILNGPLRVLGGFVNMLAIAADPATRAIGVAQLKDFGQTFLQSLGKIGGGIIKDAGSFAVNVMPKVFNIGAMMLYHSLAAAFQYGAAMVGDRIKAVYYRFMAATSVAPSYKKAFTQAAENLENGSVSHKDIFLRQAQSSLEKSMHDANAIANAFGQWSATNTRAAVGEAGSSLSQILQRNTAFGYSLRKIRSNKAAALDAYRNAAQERRAEMFRAFNVGWSNGQPVPYSAKMGMAAERARERYESYGVQMERARMLYMQYSRMERQMLKQSPMQQTVSEMSKKVDDVTSALERISALMEGVLGLPGVQMA